MKRGSNSSSVVNAKCPKTVLYSQFHLVFQEPPRTGAKAGKRQMVSQSPAQPRKQKRPKELAQTGNVSWVLTRVSNPVSFGLFVFPELSRAINGCCSCATTRGALGRFLHTLNRQFEL